MPDEVVDQGAVAEPQNVREAIALRQSQGIPEIVNTPDEPVEQSTESVDPAAEYVADHQQTTQTTPPASEAPDPFAEFGGRETVSDAVQIAQAMRTEQGLRYVVAQGLHALGYDPAQVRAALEQRGATPAEAAEATAATQPETQVVDPLAGLSDDDVLTAADARKLLDAARAEAARAAQAAAPKVEPDQRVDAIEQQLAAQRQAVATQTTDSTLIELLGPPPDDAAEQETWRQVAQGVLAQAQVGFDPNNWDPLAIRQAIIRGHAAFVAEQDRLLAAYAQRKAADRAKAPSHIGGGQLPSNEQVPQEPKNAREATKLLKEQGLFR